MPRATGAPRPPIDDEVDGAGSRIAHDPEDQPWTALDAAPLALVVDDEPEILALVGEFLEQLGLRALSTAEPDAVVELAARHRPALILLDVMMRGTDGYTLATRLRGDGRTAAIPLVFMTGQEAPIYRTLSFGVGAVAHVQKPFTLTTFRAAIGQALGT